MNKDENMRIYNQVREVPTSAQKQFKADGFSGTDINPMWRIKMLTEIFGPCGFGWYYEVLSERCETHLDRTIAVVDLNLYVKLDGEWSKPIYGTGGNKLVFEGNTYDDSGKKIKALKLTDEGYKMALTDALSIACKSLGIGADIWYANDETKYTRGQTVTSNRAEAPKMASEAQKKVLAQVLEPVRYAAMQAKYGANLERLTAETAGKALAKAKEGGAA